MENNILDLIIIGAGPAGLTASIYASCFHLKHLVIGNMIGGQLLNAPHILNYPGFVDISGRELSEKMVAQVNARGGELVKENVFNISKNNRGNFDVETEEGKKYQSKTLIIATGTERRKLNIPGEVEYTSKGVHYCATCEKFDYEGKICVVIGGGNSAVQAAVELGQAASKVYVVYRGNELRGDAVWIDQIDKNPNIEVIYKTQILEIKGDGEKVTEMIIKSESEKNLRIDKVFIEIGGVPGSALLIPVGVKTDKGGYLLVDEKLATSVAGVFAAGDLVSYGLSIEQISTAVGLGARAAASAFAYLKNNKVPVLWGANQVKI